MINGHKSELDMSHNSTTVSEAQLPSPVNNTHITHVRNPNHSNLENEVEMELPMHGNGNGNGTHKTETNSVAQSPLNLSSHIITDQWGQV